MWHLSTNYYSSCSRIAGMIKNIDTHIKKFPGNLSLSEIQKIMLMSTAQILRKTLSVIS